MNLSADEAAASQLAYQFSRLLSDSPHHQQQQQQLMTLAASFDYGVATAATAGADVIDLAIDELTLSSPQVYVSQSPLDDVLVTCRVTNRSRSNRCSPPGCHLRCRRGRGLAVGPERLLLPPLLPGLSVACQLRLRAPATAPTGWHRVEVALHSPLGGILPGDAARRCFDVHVAAAAALASGETRVSEEDMAMMD